MQKILTLAPTDIVDYLFLMDIFKKYEQPRAKIAYLLKKGALIRVKKGLYIIGPTYSRGLYSREILANLIYGPSYVSFEYALSYYNLIPERVEEVTSVTCSRNKTFDTPVGRFSYHYLHLHKYPIGVTYTRWSKGGFQIATKEKALADSVARQANLKSRNNVADYLFGLRIEENELAKMSLKKFSEIAKIYGTRSVNLLYEFLKEYHE